MLVRLFIEGGTGGGAGVREPGARTPLEEILLHSVPPSGMVTFVTSSAVSDH